MVSALTLGVALLAGTAALGAGERAVLRSVALRAGPPPAIKLGLTKGVAPAVHRLENPPRVYVDLPDTTLAARVARSVAGTGAVKRVRLGQFDAATARVVVELAEPVIVDAHPNAHGLSLVVGAATAAAPVATTRAPAAKPSAKPVATAQAPVTATPSVAAAPLPPDVPRLLVIRTDAPIAEPIAEPKTVAAPTAKPADRTVSTSLQERIGRRAADEDWAGVVALYAADMRAVEDDADSATRAAVVDALRELGLVHSARKLLGPAVPNEAPALRIARAELALADGAPDDAVALVVGLDESTVDPMLAPKLRRVQVRLALARGDLAAAVAGIGNRASPELRAELADAAIRVGRGASDKRSCKRGVIAFKTALDADGGRTANAAAGAGLVRAGLACLDADAATHGLGVLAESPHPLLRRAATAIANAVEEKPAPAAGRGG
jgi:hypothetical protein